MIEAFSWQRMSRKLKEKLQKLQYVGFFTEETAKEKQLRLVVGKEGFLHLYFLVDESDGVICDARFQVIGPIGLIAAAEVASELVLRKNYDQVSRLSAELIDHHVRDKKETPAFPASYAPYLNQVLSAIDHAVEQCLDLPFSSTYETTPLIDEWMESGSGIPDWEQFPSQQKKQIIEEVLEKEIRPYIELDAGGVELIDLKENGEVLISYQGSCTSCYAATGSTLTAMQKILRARVHPSLFVTPTNL